jgi:phosphoribosyl-AMP cyclohydrolase
MADEANTLVDAVRFDAAGLVPVITQEHRTGEVMMMAWMNRESLVETMKTGRLCYWSRSRQELWRKGDTSGHVQKLVEMRVDCDGDTLLALIEQTGAACHTGASNCFYRAAAGETLVVVTPARFGAMQT